MSNMDKEQIRFFENISSNAFVGLEDKNYDGWELRFTQGFTGRANSVQIKDESTIELSEKIDFCEKEYAKHNLPCIFKLTDAENQTPLIYTLLHMRRIETFWKGMRFQDVKRYGIEFVHELDGEPSIVFKTGDLRGALQLPQDVIDAGLEANPR